MDQEPVVIEDLVKIGEERGLERAVVLAFEDHLDRALTDPERATVVHRLRMLGRKRLNHALFSLDQEALAAWLANPAAR